MRRAKRSTPLWGYAKGALIIVSIHPPKVERKIACQFGFKKIGKDAPQLETKLVGKSWPAGSDVATNPLKSSPIPSTEGGCEAHRGTQDSVRLFSGKGGRGTFQANWSVWRGDVMDEYDTIMYTMQLSCSYMEKCMYIFIHAWLIYCVGFLIKIIAFLSMFPSMCWFDSLGWGLFKDQILQMNRQRWADGLCFCFINISCLFVVIHSCVWILVKWKCVIPKNALAGGSSQHDCKKWTYWIPKGSTQYL